MLSSPRPARGPVRLMAVQRNGPGAGLAYADRSLFLRRLLGGATQPHTNGCEGAQFST